MTETTVNSGMPYSVFRKENLILFLALVVLLLSYIGSMGFYSHHATFGVNCCGATFWWSPLGCSVALVGASLLLRLRSVRVYPVVMLMSLFALAFSSYVTFQRWIDYWVVDKAVALQQAVLPLYRPLSILLSVFILSIMMRRVINIFQPTRK